MPTSVGNSSALVADAIGAAFSVSFRPSSILNNLGSRARGGSEALRLSQEYKSRIDLVIYDVIIPAMNGREPGEHNWYPLALS